MRVNATLHKTMRGRRSERTTRDVGSGDDDCSDNSMLTATVMLTAVTVTVVTMTAIATVVAETAKSGEKNNNQLKPAVEKAATAVNAALASILLAS
jgi:hypothetical protein